MRYLLLSLVALLLLGLCALPAFADDDPAIFITVNVPEVATFGGDFSAEVYNVPAADVCKNGELLDSFAYDICDNHKDGWQVKAHFIKIDGWDNVHFWLWDYACVPPGVPGYYEPTATDAVVMDYNGPACPTGNWGKKVSWTSIATAGSYPGTLTLTLVNK